MFKFRAYYHSLGGWLLLLMLAILAGGCAAPSGNTPVRVHADIPRSSPTPTAPDPFASSARQPVASRTPAGAVAPEAAPTERTATATSQPAPDRPLEPYPDAPLCEQHDPLAYHALWNAELGCHYDHTHADDPHAADDVFGTAIYDWLGGEISYPWQTFSDAGTENELKHGGYFWLVRTPAEIGGCSSQFADGCITAFRALTHFMMLDQGARTRFHSYWFEAQACREAAPEDCGILRTGGWFDTGDLLVDDQLVQEEPRPVVRAPRPFKLHYSNPFATWYPTSPFVRVSMEVADAWGLVILDADEASEVQMNSTGGAPQAQPRFFCYGEPGCELNNSLIQPHIIAVQLPRSVETSAGKRLSAAAIMDPDGDGRGNFSGFVDRYGRILVNPDGTPMEMCDIGLDCIPLEIENLYLGMQYQLRDAPAGERPKLHPTGRAWPGSGYREYDIYFDGQTTGWIQYTGP